MSVLRPIFIGGAGRSGTTLAADLIGTHAQLSPVYETNFVLAVAHLLFAERPRADTAAAIRRLMSQWAEPLPHRPHHKRPHERYVHGPHYILFDRDYALQVTETLIADLAADPIAAFRRFVDSLFRRHAQIDGKPFWVNKTPTYVNALPFLERVWPDLLFIHCVRDGRDVAASVLTRPWGPDTWSEAGIWWRDQVNPALDFAAHHPGRVLVVRYEDLLTRPVPVLEHILTELGLEDAATTVERYLAAGAVLDPSRAGTWRQHPPSDIEAFAAAAGPTLRCLGYEPA